MGTKLPEGNTALLSAGITLAALEMNATANVHTGPCKLVEQTNFQGPMSRKGKNAKPSKGAKDGQSDRRDVSSL